MSSTVLQETPRRHLSDRRARTVDGLVDAAVEELASTGYHAMTVRRVADRAGVSPATAYTYFASKEHLIAEVFWRRISGQDPRPDDRRRSPANRAATVLHELALVVADEAELAAACTIALLADDPEVHELREKIGRRLHERLHEAVGTDANPAAVRTLEFAFSGALLRVGTGHLGYDVLPERLTEAAHEILSRPAAGGAS